jgi:hypothetical protein
MITKNSLVSNVSTFLQTTLATEASLAGQLLSIEQTLITEKYPIGRTETRRPAVSKRKGQNLEASKSEQGGVHNVMYRHM